MDNLPLWLQTVSTVVGLCAIVFGAGLMFFAIIGFVTKGIDLLREAIKRG